MNRSLLMALALTLTACGDKDDSTSRDDTGACVTVEDGAYEARGSCFGMVMTVDLAMDASSCAFTLDGWSMDHGDPPNGGAVDGDQVTLTGGSLDGCTGTAEEGTLSGVCTDGCAWEFTYDG